MNILGLDLSLTSTGVAHPDGTVERLRPKSFGMERLAWFRSTIEDLVFDRTAERSPVLDLVAIEGYSMGPQRGSSGIAQALGELGGVVRLLLYDLEVPTVEIPPSTLKKFATGKGNASKEEMLVAAVRRLGYEGSSNDEADALWLRVAALDAYGLPEIEMPKAQRDALGKVDWPVLPDDLIGVA